MITAQQTRQPANAAASRKNSRAGFFSPLPIQPTLTISQPGDVYEQEADAMADKVMRMPDRSAGDHLFFRPAASAIQRKCSHCQEEEKQLQRKESNTEATTDTPTERYINSLSGGQALNEQERSFFEPRMGYDFGKVHLHTGAAADQSAKSINALAYTYGNDIVFASNQYQPDTSYGKQLLAHELTHVIQQDNGLRKVSRAAYTVGNSRVNIDYGNVVFHDNVLEYESELESRFTGYTGQPAALIHADISALPNAQKRWLLYAIDLLTDNPLSALDKLSAVRRLIEYVPYATYAPLVGYDYRTPRFNYESEVLRVSGWFELALTAGLAAPAATDQQLLNSAYNHAASASNSATGSSCPATRSASQVLDEPLLRTELPSLMQTFLQGQVTALNGRGIRTQNIGDISPIADIVQQQALQFFSPFIGNSSSKTYLQNWRFSAHLTSSTAAGAIPPDALRAYLANRAEGRADDSGLFRRVHYDSRCAADTAVFNDIIDQLLNNTTIQTQLAAIMSWQSFTGHSNNAANTVINLQYFSNQNECAARWRTINTLCHELVHPYVHPDFSALTNGRRIITEGFTEVLGDQLYTSLRTRAMNNPSFRALFEGGLTAGICNGTDIPEAELAYGDDGRYANAIRMIVGDNRFRAAYFLGQTRLAGLQPKLEISQPNDVYEQEADAMADKVIRIPEMPVFESRHLPANVSRAIVASPAAHSDAMQAESSLLPAIGPPLISRQEETSGISEEQRRKQTEELCIGVIPGQGEQRYEFSRREQSTLTFVKFAAASILARALQGLGSGDPYVLRVARRIFHRQDISQAFLISRIEQIRDKLNAAAFLGGTCSDMDCYTPSVVAHALPAADEIVICKRFFHLSVGQMRRTLIHEAAHNVGIDDARVLRMDDESYCRENYNDLNECQDPCNNISDHVNNVDAWTRCIECIAYAY